MSELKSHSKPGFSGEGGAGSFLQPGLVLNDKWEILGHVASGGKGEIYRAHQISLERVVALKVISPDFVDSFKDNPEELEAEKERFRREVRIMAGVRHPNVLQVFDYDTAKVDGAVIEYLVMEYIPGSTLRSTMPLEGFGADSERVISWLKNYYLPMLDGVTAIHEAGIIHRDIKPENILLDGPAPKIADFGLARVLQQPGLTNSFHILGTIFYMSKQQFEDGAAVDAKADVYALGKVLYEAVTGKITNAGKVIFKEVGLCSGANNAYAGDFFESLDSIIRKATREESSGRTSSVAELAGELRALIARYDTSTSERAFSRERFMRKFYASFIVLLVILILMLSYHFSRETGTSSQQESVTDNGVEQAEPIEKGLTEQIFTHDGANMSLMPPGQKKWRMSPADEEITANVAPLYAEKALVNNRQFVSFLNAVKENLIIRDNTVYLEDSVIYLLGEVREGYEPIIYENGRFSLKSPVAAEEPVVRVSGGGALAYARHYGRELPDVPQWLTIWQQGLVSGEQAYDAIKEWGMDRAKGEEEFYVFEEPLKASAVFCPLLRQKWEVSEHVGFRTVLPITKAGGL